MSVMGAYCFRFWSIDQSALSPVYIAYHSTETPTMDDETA
jgi:hypothetical protein